METTTSTIKAPRRQAIQIFQPSADRLAVLNLWFAEEYRSLLRFAHFLAGERTSAEDIVQDAYVRIYKSGPKPHPRLVHALQPQGDPEPQSVCLGDVVVRTA